MQLRTGTGVRMYDDHRDNLTIDVHSDLVLGRAAEMRSEHSHSALLWNVFRSLQRIDARLWLPRLSRAAFPAPESGAPGVDLGPTATYEELQFHWWRRWDLPRSRHDWLRDAALAGELPLDHHAPRAVAAKKTEAERRMSAELPLEDPVEIPLGIETPSWLLAVEAVFKGNLRRHTPFDAHRDAVVRLLDAGTHAASELGKRFGAIIVCADARSLNQETARLVERYRGRPDRLEQAMPHRGDLEVVHAAAGALGLVRWKDLGSLLIAVKDEERLGAFDVAALDELIKYLGRKDLGFNFFRRLK
jgi:hypothetical protein